MRQCAYPANPPPSRPVAAVHGLYFGNDPRMGWINETCLQYGELTDVMPAIAVATERSFKDGSAEALVIKILNADLPIAEAPDIGLVVCASRRCPGRSYCRQRLAATHRTMVWLIELFAGVSLLEGTAVAFAVAYLVLATARPRDRAGPDHCAVHRIRLVPEQDRCG